MSRVAAVERFPGTGLWTATDNREIGIEDEYQVGMYQNGGLPESKESQQTKSILGSRDR